MSITLPNPGGPPPSLGPSVWMLPGLLRQALANSDAMLITGQPDPRMDRPSYDVLTRFLDEGLMNQFLGLAAPGEWLTTFPFNGSEGQLFNYYGIPPDSVVPQPSCSLAPPATGCATSAQFSGFLSAAPADALPWARIGNHLWVLQKNPELPGFDIDPNSPNRYGLDRDQIMLLGLAYELLVASMDQLPTWFQEMVSNNLWPTTTSTAPLEIYPDWLPIQASQTGTSRELLSLVSRWISGQAGRTIAMYSNPFSNGAAASNNRTHFIEWRSDVIRPAIVLPFTAAAEQFSLAVNSGGDVAAATLALQTTAVDALIHITYLAGVMLHEVMHLTWAEEFNRPTGSNGDWGSYGVGPLFTPEVVQRYRYAPFLIGNVQSQDIPGATPGAVAPMLAPSRHYANYLATTYFVALLRRNNSSRFLNVHTNWANPASTAPPRVTYRTQWGTSTPTAGP